MKFTIRQLEIFKEVATNGHVTNSCEMLGISQSAISMSIQELEHNLNVKLFERRNRKLILNETGRVLLDKSEQLLQELKELEHIFLENKIAGHLIVGASMTIADYLLPFIIYDFMTKYPECQIELVVANTREITEKLSSGEIDVAYVEGYVDGSKFETRKWLQDELIVVASDKNEFSKKSYTIEDLYDKHWISRELGSGTRSIFQQILSDKFSKLNIFMTIGNTEAIKRIVSRSEGLACLPRIAVKRDLMEGKLFEVPLEGYKFDRDLLCLTFKDKYQSYLLKEFMSFAFEYDLESLVV